MTLVFPADSPEPQLERRAFSVEHAMLFTTGVDLEKSYGNEKGQARFEWFGLDGQPDELTHGEYCIYFTLSPNLLTNRCLTRAFGVGSDALNFRGDVVVVKQECWSQAGPFAVYGVHHATYFDVHPSMVPVLVQKTKNLHSSLAGAIGDGLVRGTCVTRVFYVMSSAYFRPGLAETPPRAGLGAFPGWSHLQKVPSYMFPGRK